jgi:hypothetical protein
MSSIRFLSRLSLSFALLVAGRGMAAELALETPPEQVAREAYARMQASDWVAAADTFDPAALKRFRELLLPVLDAVGKDQTGKAQSAESRGAFMLWVLFAPATSVEEIKALSDREVFARIMANTMSMASAKREGQTVIGSVAEGPDIVHVVTRNNAKVGAETLAKVEAITLHRTAQGWRLALTGDLEGLAETLQGLIAPPEAPSDGPASR